MLPFLGKNALNIYKKEIQAKQIANDVSELLTQTFFFCRKKQ
jgi:hypothetical protein